MRSRPPLRLADGLTQHAQAAAESDHATGIPHGYFQTHPVPAVRQVIGEAIGLFWSEGPGGGHYENLLGPFDELGCGFATGGSTLTFVQNFQ